MPWHAAGVGTTGVGVGVGVGVSETDALSEVFTVAELELTPAPPPQALVISTKTVLSFRMI